jgi:restriction system protein
LSRSLRFSVLSGCVSLIVFGAAAWAALWFGGSLAPVLVATILLVALVRFYGIVREARRLRSLRLADIDSMAGADFEEYLAAVLEDQGFRVEWTGTSGDLGVDLIAEQGEYRCAVQAKRQTAPVSRRAVSDAVAGMAHYGCNAAMVVTNSYFTDGAVELAESTGCELIDRNTLAEWVFTFQHRRGRGNGEMGKWGDEGN